MNLMPIQICTAADKRYVMPLATLLNSIIKNNPEPFILNVLQTGISKRAQNRLHKLCDGTQGSLNFIDMNKYDFNFDIKDMRYWSKAIFYRMAIPDIFPNLDKMLYIDCDTLVLKSLSPLYNTEMSENSIVAMVGDRFIMLSVRTVPKYHNSGMILFDIKKSREFNLFEKCCKWLKANKDIIEFPDQDAINHVLSGHIHRVSNVYNLQVVAYSNSLDYYLENNPAMLHFIGKIKPWSLSHLIHWAAPMYIKYIPFESDKRKIKIIAKMSKILFRCSPRFTLVKTPSKDPKKRTAEAMKYIEFKKQQPSVQDIK